MKTRTKAFLVFVIGVMVAAAYNLGYLYGARYASTFWAEAYNELAEQYVDTVVRHNKQANNHQEALKELLIGELNL